MIIANLCHWVSTEWKSLGISVKMYMQLVTTGLLNLLKLTLAKSLTYGLFPVNVDCPYTRALLSNLSTNKHLSTNHYYLTTHREPQTNVNACLHNVVFRYEIMLPWM